MVKFNRLLRCLIPFLLVYSWSLSAHADEGPWKWQLSLNIKKERQGNKMLLPTGLYVDKERERYYVVDAGDNSLHSFDFQGNHLNTLKPGDQLKQPYAMVRNDHDILWVVEKGRNSLTEIDLKEKKILPHNLSIGDREVFPDKIVFSEGSFFVLDKLTGAIIKFDHDLKVGQEICRSEGRGGFVDFSIKNGAIFALDNISKFICSYDHLGHLQSKINIANLVIFPNALDIGSGGQIYILDRHECSVIVLDESGTFKYKFLAKGQSRGRLYYPEDIQFDFLGRLCIVDSGNGRVEIFGR